MTKENGLELPGRIGSLNFNGSRDYGCMMINNFAHPDFFNHFVWSNPLQNTAYAYQIFKSRGNWSAWYSVCSTTKQPKYQGIWCK